MARGLDRDAVSRVPGRTRPSLASVVVVLRDPRRRQATRDDHHALEYFILSPRPTAFHIETLAELTLQWADADPKPSLGSIIDTGRPWIDDAAADHFFVTLPYPFGPGFENVVHDDLHIQIMWLLPITKTEAAFIQQTGIDAFEQLAESSNVEFADPQRASLV